MEASQIDIAEQVPASRKLTGDDARELQNAANKLIVAKGKKVTTFTASQLPSDDATAAMLGPTGNLRAPTIRVGKTLLVGFNEDAYGSVFG